MSADNGIYIARFPTHDWAEFEYRVGVNLSDTAVNELCTHWFSPDEYRDAVITMWRDDVFDTYADAFNYAVNVEREMTEVGLWTEHGICDIELPVPYGEKKQEDVEPALPDWACEHCSDPKTETWIGHEMDKLGIGCKNPNTPFNVAVKAFRDSEYASSAINIYPIVRVIVEALDDGGYLE